MSTQDLETIERILRLSILEEDFLGQFNRELLQVSDNAIHIAQSLVLEKLSSGEIELYIHNAQGEVVPLSTEQATDAAKDINNWRRWENYQTDLLYYLYSPSQCV